MTVQIETSAKLPTLPTRDIGTTGVTVTALGFGGASVGNMYRVSPEDVAQGALAAALEGGMNYFDTAPLYGFGLSETRFGRFLAARTPASPLTLSTKVGRVMEPAGPDGPPDDIFVDPLPYQPVYDYSYDGVMRSFAQSQERLGVDRIDVLYMHDIGRVTHGEKAHPELFREAMEGGYRAMAELKANGCTSAIGLGVNEWEVCEESFAHADFDVFMLAGRYTLLEQDALETFLPECTKRGVSVVCAGPFNSGLLARRPDPASHYNYSDVPPELAARTQRIFDVCEAHGASTQAAALQFPLAHPAIVTVVGGMATAERVERSLAWMKTPTPDGVWRDLRSEGLVRADAPVPGDRT